MSAARKPLIAGNWKMNGTRKEGLALAKGIAKQMKKLNKKKTNPAFEMLVCPPYTLIERVAAALKGSGVMIGAQDCHTAEKGAHTGDISPVMLKDMGCKYVIVGHSERRADHGEKDAPTKAKAEAALAAGLTAIVCVGETLAQRDGKRTLGVIRSQIRGSLPEGATAKNTVIAYEPVWAIGTGRVATPDQAQEVHAAIRGVLTTLLGEKAGDKMRILYGGSMKPGNAKELISLPDVDGGLIGGASLKADDFFGIAKNCP
ncbi:MAG TPA: triose-phosphate isomerase [Rhodospirillales bacterium]|nr:triose-phosphate isomerase [Rhodospirillales bacterium]